MTARLRLLVTALIASAGLVAAPSAHAGVVPVPDFGYSLQPVPVLYGSPRVVAAFVRGSGGATPTGTLTATLDGAVVGTVAVQATTPPTATATIPLPADTPAGFHSVVVTYSGDTVYAPVSQKQTLQVFALTPVVDATAAKRVLHRGRHFRIEVGVAAPGLVPPGSVTVTKGRKVVGSGTLHEGTVSIRLARPLKVGRHVLTATYLGFESVLPASDQVTVKVRR